MTVNTRPVRFPPWAAGARPAAPRRSRSPSISTRSRSRAAETPGRLHQHHEGDHDRAQRRGAPVEPLDVERHVRVGGVDVLVEDVEGERDAQLVDDQGAGNGGVQININLIRIELKKRSRPFGPFYWVVPDWYQ